MRIALKLRLRFRSAQQAYAVVHSSRAAKRQAGNERVVVRGALLFVAMSIVASVVPYIASADESRDGGIAELVERVKQSVVVVSFTGRDGEPLGLGSGFIVDPSGLIATNLHVLGEARPIRVRTIAGEEYPVASVHATDRVHDLAILKVDATDLPALELGDSDTLEQGQSIIAVGNPLGLEHSVVQGVISGLREDVDGLPMIQLAIPIERGNSGGPVVDRQGRVQGLITLKSQLTENLGYAVAVNALKPLLEEPNPIPMSEWLTIGTLNARLWEAPDDVRWRQRAGRILVDGRGQGFGGRSLCLSHKQIPEGTFEVAVTVKMDQEDGAAGLIFHADGGDRHYGFYPSSGQLRFSRFDGPDVFSWNVLGEERTPKYRPGDWNRLKVRIDGGLIQCYCNDSLVFESRDDRYTAGRVGLAKFRHTTAQFKGFEVGTQVKSLTPPPDVQASLIAMLDALPLSRPPEMALVDDVLSKAEARASGSVLREEARRLEQQAARVRQLADAVYAESVTRKLQALFADKEQPPDLIHAALLIAALDNEELDVAAYRVQVDEMAEELAASIGDEEGAGAKRQALHRYLFEQRGFHGSRTNYGSASNSYLNEVIDDREGLPITLSVLYLSLAGRIGLTAEGIGLPGHFVVRVREGDDWQLIDVFDRGSLMSQEDAAKKVASITLLGWQDAYLDPQSPRAIIVRMLRNLTGVANQAENAEDALRYVNALLALEPDSAVDRLFRAVLCYNTRRTEQALADTDWLLQREPEEIPMFRVRQLREMIESLDVE